MTDSEVKVETEESRPEVKGEVPSDDELKRVTLEILGQANLEEITKKEVRRSAESKLGLVLSLWLLTFPLLSLFLMSSHFCCDWVQSSCCANHKILQQQSQLEYTFLWMMDCSCS